MSCDGTTYGRRAALGLGLAALVTGAGCGFTPLYAPGAPGDRLRGLLVVTPPDDRASFAFAAQVEQLLGRVDSGPYRLTYAISTTTEDQAITPDQAIQRIALLGAVEYSVIENATGRTLTSGRQTAFTGFNTTSTIVATRTSARDAQARLMVLLANAVVSELVASGAGWLP